jgi:peroxiredoxin
MLRFLKLLDLSFGASMKTLQPGQAAPEFTLDSVSGGKTSLAEILAAGPALFAFYKVTCPTCQLTLPFLDRLQGGSLKLFAISQDDARAVREFNAAFDTSLPTLLDKAADGYPVSNAFGITHVPSLFLVEPDRSISWSWVGFHKRQLEALARRAGRPIFHPGEQVPESKSG